MDIAWVAVIWFVAVCAPGSTDPACDPRIGMWQFKEFQSERECHMGLGSLEKIHRLIGDHKVVVWCQPKDKG